jgi:hypothetical protein
MVTVGEFPRRLTSLDLGKMRWLGGRQPVGLDDRAEFASSIPYVSGALENRRLTIVDLGVNGYAAEKRRILQSATAQDGFGLRRFSAALVFLSAVRIRQDFVPHFRADHEGKELPGIRITSRLPKGRRSGRTRGGVTPAPEGGNAGFCLF